MKTCHLLNVARLDEQQKLMLVSCIKKGNERKSTKLLLKGNKGGAKGMVWTVGHRLRIDMRLVTRNKRET